MIKTDHEYKEAKTRLQIEFTSIEDQKKKLIDIGLTSEQIRLALDPLRSFALQLQEEVEQYERLKRGQFDPLENLQGLGSLLVAARIAKGITQKELAERLGLHESQISRDERNEYHGASIEKIQRVLSALKVILRSEINGIYSDAG
jgi:ribosome-binding protein aMBF1 (putative translation factor)